MQISRMQDVAGEVSGLLRTLAHPGRLLLLCHMAEDAPTVGELARRIGRTEAAVSQMLARLRHEGLVRAERDGQSMRYAIARTDVARLLAFLHDAYCREETKP